MKEASSKKPSRIVKPGVKRDIIFDFKPKVFPLIATQEAHDFISSQKQGSSDFKIADMVAEQAGIANLQKQGLENKIEELVLEKLKDVQEGAYKSAYDLGLEEGKKEAYLQNEKIIFDYWSPR